MSAGLGEKNMHQAEPVHPRLERRAKPRVAVPFRALVQGTDEEGAAFEVATVVDNLAAGGLYLRITKEVGRGTRLLINVCMSCQTVEHEEPCMSLEVYGRIIRVERMAGGAFGVAVSFTNSIFLTR